MGWEAASAGGIGTITNPYQRTNQTPYTLDNQTPHGTGLSRELWLRGDYARACRLPPRGLGCIFSSLSLAMLSLPEGADCAVRTGEPCCGEGPGAYLGSCV